MSYESELREATVVRPRFTPSQLAQHEAHKAARLRLDRRLREKRPDRIAKKPAPAVCLEAINARLRLAAIAERISARLNGRRPSVQDIIAEVADFYSLSQAEIYSRRRTANLVRPRQIATYLAKQLTGGSLPWIGRQMGGRDHTTSLHSIRKIECLIETDAAVRADVDLLTARLAPNSNPEGSANG